MRPTTEGRCASIRHSRVECEHDTWTLWSGTLICKTCGLGIVDTLHNTRRELDEALEETKDLRARLEKLAGEWEATKLRTLDVTGDGRAILSGCFVEATDVARRLRECLGEGK